HGLLLGEVDRDLAEIGILIVLDHALQHQAALFAARGEGIDLVLLAAISALTARRSPSPVLSCATACL
ncbi:hypothetical protein, partial [Escherichia coli]|uniref:hypothetical protein n=1 Tax=Escherichia coli TaxID=562 RepID=UPI0013D4D7D6